MVVHVFLICFVGGTVSWQGISFLTKAGVLSTCLFALTQSSHKGEEMMSVRGGGRH